MKLLYTSLSAKQLDLSGVTQPSISNAFKRKDDGSATTVLIKKRFYITKKPKL